MKTSIALAALLFANFAWAAGGAAVGGAGGGTSGGGAGLGRAAGTTGSGQSTAPNSSGGTLQQQSTPMTGPAAGTPPRTSGMPGDMGAPGRIDDGTGGTPGDPAAPGPSGRTDGTPLPSTSIGANGAPTFNALDRNADGRITPDEAQRTPTTVPDFNSFDTNHDGAVDSIEFNQGTHDLPTR